MKTNNALYQPHIQQHLKDTTKYINGFLKSNGAVHGNLGQPKRN
ncbi:hypothetical protein JCM19240_2907 [Vibrio maritimus]|uniref:Uncharacterized protein n=1 Tax=Vibrio maritimus TaxID=990268 RepID=A0A090TC06_9VIBR|nr:hypothetical protein JCM19240_2907 [Vibrio maritimus]